MNRKEYEEKAFDMIWDAHVDAGGHDFQDLCEGATKVVADLLEQQDSQMKVYIVFRDVPFEFGEIYHVCSSRQKAEELRIQCVLECNCMGAEEQFKIQEWDVE